ncbi:olfactory receptor 14A16-like [Chelonoidis abingdonii]|uniref:olfactory receptor 14A16-like n=1 Tax=Chelonoidis abingdonii TaxID=106734 RepID=UPI0013F23BC5|nr:olfactory receptor 14A16-like [Chelonoidis abingdonii]
MSNQTILTEFLLLGFSDVRELQILHFVVFLVIYLVALVGNLVIVMVVALSHQLHTPMYFFLGNLSFLDICYISVTVPKSMANSLTNTSMISFSGCVAQVFLVLTLAFAEMILLVVMAYDRYVAICRPLHYKVIMNKTMCIQMATGCWISAVLYSVMHTGNTFRLPFCRSNVIGQFFCDIPQLLKISCYDTSANEILVIVCVLFFGFLFVVSIFISYIHIFSTILRIPSTQGKYKAFSTCLPHLIVFSLFMSTTMFTYMRPKSMSSLYQDLLAAVFYSVVPPVLNPMIYSLRNKEIKDALGKMLHKVVLIKNSS